MIGYPVILRILGFSSSSFSRKIHHPRLLSSPNITGFLPLLMNASKLWTRSANAYTSSQWTFGTFGENFHWIFWIHSKKSNSKRDQKLLLEGSQEYLSGRPVFYQWIGEIPRWYQYLREITSSHTARSTTKPPKKVVISTSPTEIPTKVPPCTRRRINWSIINFKEATRWAPTSYKKGYNSTYRGYNPSYPFIRPFIGAHNSIYNQ